jgi:hypothetical protein
MFSTNQLLVAGSDIEERVVSVALLAAPIKGGLRCGRTNADMP